MLTVNALGWFSWLVVGVLAGWLATAVLWPRRQHGLLFGVVLGILGASLGGIIFTAVRFSASTEFRAFPVAGLFPAVTGFSVWSILVAFVAALVLLGLRRLLLDIRVMKLPH
jgi:uncharacterized membrane protein YeaQ/YmgE (transglycosylase-associated protein family)